MIVGEIKGDLLSTNIKYIAHGVNCQNVMGSGVAKAIYSKYPEVKKIYHNFCETLDKTELLGSVNPVKISENKTVFNLFTQFNYGYNGELYLSYDALRKSLKTLVNHYKIKELAIPKIGCGLAGGDWEKVKDIINEVTKYDTKVYVYYL